MSAIAGFLARGQADATAERAAHAAAVLKRRCPDDSGTFLQDGVGLAWSWLDTGALDADRRRPFAQRDGLVIVFDGRIDDRQRLLRELASVSDGEPPVSDAELVLLAHQVWGEAAAERLLGEYAFAIWDRSRRQLRCVRDRFGVRPLYVASSSSGFAFATDLRLLLDLPEISHELDEDAIADFLLFGYHRDPGGTPFRALRQLPPSHLLTVDADGSRQRRYWSPTPASVQRYRRVEEYAEQFRDLLCDAVADRVGERRVGLLFSGGMDSTAVAACAVRTGRAAGRSTNVQAYTYTANQLCPQDEESRYARVAADFLGIELTLHAADSVAPFERWREAVPVSGPPNYHAFQASHLDLLRRVEADGIRVLLSGDGSDPSMQVSADYCAALFWGLRWRQLANEIHGSLAARGTWRGLGLRRIVPWRSRSRPLGNEIPRWIDSRFAARLALAERWRAYHDSPKGTGRREQAALDELEDAAWYETRFRQDEGDWTPVEVRYPFFDPRVIEFLMGVPQFLTVDKWVLRRAMSSWLPVEITARPKVPFRGDMLRTWMLRKGRDAFNSWPLHEVASYIDAKEYEAAIDRFFLDGRTPTPWESILLVAPVGLAVWLQNGRSGGF